MGNNEFNLKVGDKAMLDIGYKGFEREVTILFMTEPTQMFCDVIAEGETEKWQVMTKRLTPINGKETD